MANRLSMSFESILPEQKGVEFRHVAGFPGYCVSDNGDVWSRRSRAGIWHKLSPGRNVQYGHLHVELYQAGKPRQFYVHALVLTSFVGSCPDGMGCRHLDGNPANNQLSNLCWGTPKENQGDRVRHGTVTCGERNGSAKLKDAQIPEIRRRLAAGESQRSLAREYGVNHGTIGCLQHGKTWKAVT